MTALVVAHQGGWDELLFVLLPIALFAGLLAVANRRASRLGPPTPDESDQPPTPPTASSGDG